MAARYSDQEITDFIQERKPLPVDFWKQITMRNKRGHKERELEVTGEQGNQFRLILRENTINILDFSIILALCPTDTTQLFRLRRYNGKSHEHTNHIERNTFYDFHIHYATERYQEHGAREDSFAKPSDRYASFFEAVDCMIEDCGFDLPEGSKQPLFEGLNHDV